MDVVVPSICLSSLAGAFLFYAGGRLGGRLGPPAPPAEPPPLEPALAEERAARERAEQEARGAIKAQRDAVAALAEERSRSTTLRQYLAAERDARSRADAEAAGERRRLIEEASRLRASAAGATEAQTSAAAAAAEVDRMRAELARMQAATAQARAEVERVTSASRKLSGEAATLRTRVAELERAAAEHPRTTAERDRWRATAEERAVEANALREDNARLERQIAALEKARSNAPDLAEVQRRTVSATMALRSLEQRSDEVARREAEITELRRKVEGLSAAAAEAEVLRRKVKDLEAQGFARKAARTLPSEDAGPGGLAPELENGLTAGLRALRQAEPGCRTAVLSDMRGLLVAAHGDADHRLELAAAAALTTTTAERLRDLLPLGEPRGFTLVDENATVFRTRWLRWEGECFLVCTLGVDSAAADAPAEELRDRLTELIGGP